MKNYFYSLKWAKNWTFLWHTHTHTVSRLPTPTLELILVVLVPVHYFIHSLQRSQILILTQVGNFFPIRGTLWNCIRYHFFNIGRRSGNLLIRIKIAEWQVSYTPHRLGRFPHTQIGTIPTHADWHAFILKIAACRNGRRKNKWKWGEQNPKVRVTW